MKQKIIFSLAFIANVFLLQTVTAFPGLSVVKPLPNFTLARQYYIVDFGVLPREPGLKVGTISYSTGFGILEPYPNSEFYISLCLVNASDDILTDSDIIRCLDNPAKGTSVSTSYFSGLSTYNRAFIFLYWTLSSQNLPYYSSGKNAIINVNFIEVDTDGDGMHDGVDDDDDNDGVSDIEDAFPKNALESQDTDGDGIGNNADEDDDNDGVADSRDAFPLDASESVDTDKDGAGDNADLDDDNDGMSDVDELAKGRNPLVNEVNVILLINQLLLEE
ncbi:MAG: hypothetical protein KDD61_06040 [Bdellovibrionales bacterium]|nr:hypothetical protein [Bdellovibrionales bacterium]